MFSTSLSLCQYSPSLRKLPVSWREAETLLREVDYDLEAAKRTCIATVHAYRTGLASQSDSSDVEENWTLIDTEVEAGWTEVCFSSLGA